MLFFVLNGFRIFFKALACSSQGSIRSAWEAAANLCIREVFERSQGIFTGGRSMYAQIEQTQDEPQWIVAQRLLSALTIPGFK